MKKLFALSAGIAFSVVALAPITASAQSRSIQEANQHHRNQQRSAETNRQNDNRSVQRSNDTYRRK